MGQLDWHILNPSTMSALTTLNDEAREDITDDVNHLLPVLEQVDTLLTEILSRLDALEASATELSKR